MGIFGRKDPPVTEPEITGTEALRARVKSRLRHGHLARTATDLQIALPALESFANGGKLPEAAIHALVKECYMNTKWDPVSDRLVDTSPEPRVVCRAIPEPYKNPDPNLQAAHEAYQAALRAAAPAPVTRPPSPGSENAGRFAKRPGFAE